MAGYVFRPTYVDRATGEKRQSNVYWIGYSVSGKKVRESAKTEDKDEAENFLYRRLADRGLAGPAQRDLAKVKFEDLAEIIRADYRKHNRKSTDELERHIAALQEHFGGMPVPAIDERAIEAFVSDMLEDDKDYANATVNRRLSALKRMFSLGYKQRLVGREPAIEMLTEDNARKGFWSEEELAKVLGHLPAELKPIIVTAFITGWRKGEILSRKTRHVEDDWLVLETGETKNKKGRRFPLTDRLRSTLVAHEEVRRTIEIAQGRIISDLFFHYDGPYVGGPITTIQKQWMKARRASGLEHRIFHDFRRTAYRNLVRAGVPERVAMDAVGWKTRAMADRYNIVDERDLTRAGSLLDKAQEG